MSPLTLQLFLTALEVENLSCLKEAQKLKRSQTLAGCSTRGRPSETFCQPGVKAPAEGMIWPRELTGRPIDSEKILPHGFSTVEAFSLA